MFRLRDESLRPVLAGEGASQGVTILRLLGAEGGAAVPSENVIGPA